MYGGSDDEEDLNGGGEPGKEDHQTATTINEDTPQSSQDSEASEGYVLPSSASQMDSEEIFREVGTKSRKNMTSLKALSAAVSRTMISSRKAALIINAEKEDSGTLNDKTQVCPSKLYKHRCMHGQTLVDERKNTIKSKGIFGLYFDESRDPTPTWDEIDVSVLGDDGEAMFTGTNKRSIVVRKENCPFVIQNPMEGLKNYYAKTFTFTEGTALEAATKVHAFLDEYNSLEKLRILGSDSCRKNSGREGGVDALLEEMCGRPFQRIFCILHTIDLIAKKFFDLVDGKTSGPTSRTGPVGKCLNDEDLRFTQIAQFKPVPCFMEPLPDEVVKDLSNDYLYSYNLTQAVAEGPSFFTQKKNQKFITASPGKFHQARWLTGQNRIQRDWVRTPEKDFIPEQEKLVRHTQQVTAPAWFEAFRHPSMVDAPRVLHKLLTDMDNFDYDNEEDKLQMMATFNTNCYFAHYESVVIAMFYDPDPEVREKALQECLQILEHQEEAAKAAEEMPKKKPRKNAKKKKTQREFVCPEVWFEDKPIPANYWNFIDITPTAEKTIPPVLWGMTADEIKAFAADPDSLGLREIPATTQCVERAIGTLKQVILNVKTEERREQEACGVFFSRERMPHRFNTKADYRSHL